MMTLTKRLDTHFAVCAAAATGAAMFGGEKSQAAIVYSGVVNLQIANNINGLYLNMVTGQTSTNGFAGEDINPYFGGTNMWMAPAFGNAAVTTDGTSAQNMPSGTPVGPSSLFAAGAYPTMGNFLAGQPGLFGIRFMRESDTTLHYGWLRIVKTTGGNGTVVDYAYEDTANAQILAGATGVPGPGSLALLAVGAL